ncbi:NB-ARC domain-containing protein [Actinokineospora sp. NPDC004072]
MPARGQAVPAAAATAVSVLVAVLVNLLTSGWSWLIFLALAALSLLWAGLEVWRSAPGGGRRARPAPPVAADGLVARPELAGAVVRALLAGGRRRVGITTALAGAGGFGKTTLAAQVCDLPEIKAAFPSIYWVTVGQEVRGAALADTVNDVIERVARRRSGLTSPEQAGLQLGELLAEQGRALLVVDDVWTAEQLRPFLNAARGCSLLVTTRIPDLLPEPTQAVRVDQMNTGQATELLSSGLAELPAQLGERLLEVTGRWPLTLRLANASLRRTARDGGDVGEAAERLLRRLGELGPAALDVADAAGRDRTVAATLESSLGVLGSARDRALELAIFPEDTGIPLELVAHLWRGTAGLSAAGSEGLCRELVELSLVTAEGDRLRLHDVIRTYLRHECGADRLARLHGSLLAEVVATLPDPGSGPVPWWSLPPSSSDYLWRSLAYHLDGAGRAAELAELATAPPWVIGKLRRFGPVAVAEDLAFVATPAARELSRFLDQLGHLLVPGDPDHAVVNALAQRLPPSPALDDLRSAALAAVAGVPRLVPRHALPDLPDPALNRVLVGHERKINGCAFGPDGAWLASTSADGVRVWQPETGQLLRILEGSQRSVLAEGFALSPDGRLLACAGPAHAINVWDTRTWRLEHVLTGHRSHLNCCCFSADGAQLISADLSTQVRVWDVRTGAPVRSAKSPVVLTALVGLPGGRVLALGGGMWLWDPSAAGPFTKVPRPSEFTAGSAVVSPDGRWAAVVGSAGLAVLDLDAISRPMRLLLHHGDLTAAAFSADGRTLAVGGGNGVITVWDTDSWEQAGRIAAHGSEVVHLAFAPGGAVLASAGDRTVRLWAPGRARTAAPDAGTAEDSGECAAAPDGSWLAVTRDDVVAIHDTDSGEVVDRIRTTGLINRLVSVGNDMLLVETFRGHLVHHARNWKVARLLLHPGNRMRVRTVTGGGLVCGVDADDWVVVWDTGSWAPPTFLEVAESGLRAHPVWTPRPQPWSARLRGSAHRERRLASRSIPSCAIAPDGGWLAVGRGKAVHVVAPGSWAPIARLQLDHEVVDVRASADGSRLVVAGQDGRRWWDTSTWTEGDPAALPPPGLVEGGAWAPGGGLVATVSDGQVVRVHDAADFSPLTEIRLDGEVRSCAWLADDRLVVVGGRGIFWFTYAPAGDLSATPVAGVARAGG